MCCVCFVYVCVCVCVCVCGFFFHFYIVCGKSYNDQFYEYPLVPMVKYMNCTLPTNTHIHARETRLSILAAVVISLFVQEESLNHC